VSDRFIELRGLAVFEVGMNLVEIAGKAREVHDVGLRDRAGGRYKLVPDCEIFEVAECANSEAGLGGALRP
jgi:hypothetical protein